MFDKLKAKWGVGPLDLFLILCTFAIGGSLSGYLAKMVMGLVQIEGWLYLPTYILVVTLLWPLCVICVSVPFGQFSFFSQYLKKMGKRFGLVK